MDNKKSFRTELEEQWTQVSRRPTSDPFVVAALDRLETELAVITARGHSWARKEIKRLGDEGNYKSYCLEVHFASAFEQAGLDLQHSVRLHADNQSDVDFVHVDSTGSLSVNFEIVVVNEAQGVWSEHSSSELTTISIATWGNEEIACQIRRLQDKLRIKTVKQGSPWKFPAPVPGCVNVLVADVSGVFMMQPPAWFDLAQVTCGPRAVPEHVRAKVVGLFEHDRPSVDALSNDFDHNRYFRERVHLAVFLMDESLSQSALNPEYKGSYFWNPGLRAADEAKEAALQVLNVGFCGLVSGWESKKQ